jgi:site-specific DNA-methyltransferase (adenine-specific)
MKRIVNNNVITATLALKNELAGKAQMPLVFLRHNEVKYDSENHLLAYLYLEHKTFINTHLLKAGLAEVDGNAEFKYKNKFLMI